MSVESPAVPEATTDAPRMPILVAWALAALVICALIASGIPLLFAWAMVGFALVAVGPPIGIVLMVCVGVKRSKAVTRPEAPAAVASSSELVGLPGSSPAQGHPFSPRVKPRTASLAARFGRWRQMSLLIAHIALIVSIPFGIVTSTGALTGDGSLTFLYWSGLAAIGLFVLCTAPWWMFGPSAFAGEQYALETKTGAWKLIRVHRILAWVVGGLYCALGLMVFAGYILSAGAFSLPFV